MYKISEDLRNGLLKYLASRPLGEVLDGYLALQNLEKIEEKSND